MVAKGTWLQYKAAEQRGEGMVERLCSSASGISREEGEISGEGGSAGEVEVILH